ncbi:SDR family oxidoreductase [Streptomyces sp. NPDC001691]|uniref:SDR family oxidoreductase n=1 Tax=unclassified Streptomyces TaxID=2593676 RepID=UPI000DEB855F|nr:SDR family oxidoreductase [Streptomyces sp. SDr-06]RCH61883.1 SDR family NAD(P)-dependent oxidoreductase [Streptomyces sp. SDr-06]
MTRTALVVGGNRGIGLAVARRLSADGYRVAVTYRQAPPPGEVLGVPCDVTNLDSVREAFDRVEEELGPVEVLVVNAGITRDGLLVSMSERDFAAPVLTNLTGAYRVTKRAVRGMLRARRGRIVLLSSQVALSGEAGQANYAAAKAGLIGFARSLARELGGRGITVNVVAPGLTDTDMAAALPEARRQAILAGVPMGRMVRPEEVAAAVAFLAGSDAGAITGAVVPVDGGAGMGY